MYSYFHFIKNWFDWCESNETLSIKSKQIIPLPKFKQITSANSKQNKQIKPNRHSNQIKSWCVPTPARNKKKTFQDIDKFRSTQINV